MDYEFHPEAQAEMLASATFYDEDCPGTGIEFLEDVNLTIKRILNNPTTWQKIELGMRKLHLSRFPFAIIYELEGNTVKIATIAHCKKRPGTWHKRIENL